MQALQDDLVAAAAQQPAFWPGWKDLMILRAGMGSFLDTPQECCCCWIMLNNVELNLMKYESEGGKQQTASASGKRAEYLRNPLCIIRIYIYIHTYNIYIYIHTYIHNIYIYTNIYIYIYHTCIYVYVYIYHPWLNYMTLVQNPRTLVNIMK